MDPAQRRACFGFEVRSPLSFRYLRAGPGDRLDVECVPAPEAGAVGRLLVEWLPRPERPFHGRLHASERGYQLWIENVGWFIVHPDVPWIGIPPDGDPVRREEHLWGMPASLCLLQRGDLPLHAAAVEVAGAGVLFAAPGRFGKTTLAAAFLDAGHRLLAEDLTCLRLAPAPAVVPGPAMLRVRRDVLEHFTPRHASIVGAFGDRVSFAVDEPRRGDCAPVPLRAVVLLREGPVLRLDRLAGAEALRELWALSTRIPTEENRRQCFRLLGATVASVPCYWLSRPLSIEGLSGVVDAVAHLCRSARPVEGEISF